MTQLTINIENPAILPHLKKILNALDGVSIDKATRKRHKCELDKAYDDVRAGKISHYENAAALFKAFNL